MGTAFLVLTFRLRGIHSMVGRGRMKAMAKFNLPKFPPDTTFWESDSGAPFVRLLNADGSVGFVRYDTDPPGAMGICLTGAVEITREEFIRLVQKFQVHYVESRNPGSGE